MLAETGWLTPTAAHYLILLRQEGGSRAEHRLTCSRAAKSREVGNQVGALMSRCAGSRESPALLSLAAGLLCLAVSVGKTARAGTSGWHEHRGVK